MADLSWSDAVIEVLRQADGPMHYTEIAEAISTQGLRTNLGKTPSATVNAIITPSLRDDPSGTPFQRVSRGVYALRATTPAVAASPRLATVHPGPEPCDADELADDAPETSLIKAFGMYWRRDAVDWTNRPRLLGQQQPGSDSVDFHGERGIYLLYDTTRVVYVGRVVDQPLGTRLYQHTRDRLNGRWDRFSWFGVYGIAETGDLRTTVAHDLSVDDMIVTMEALLIEALEPPQNRRRGDEFGAVEFLQVIDPELERKARREIYQRLLEQDKL